MPINRETPELCKFDAEEIKKIHQLAKQAKCLSGMLASLPDLCENLTIGMMLSSLTFAEDIDRAMNAMLKPK